MKKSELKQLIKEEIQKEIKVTPGGGNPLSYFKKMLEVDDDGTPLINVFSLSDSLEDWMADSEYDEDDDSKEAKETLALAKIYYDWQSKGLIYCTSASDSDDVYVQTLTKPFKTMVTYGDGYDNVLIILAAF